MSSRVRAEAYFLEGVMKNDSGQPEAAIASFLNALDCWPEFGEALRELLRTFQELRSYRAIDVIEQILDVLRFVPHRRRIYIDLCQRALELYSPIHNYGNELFIRRSLSDLLDAMKTPELKLPAGTAVLDD